MRCAIDGKVWCIDDGAAHLVASLQALGNILPKGPVWNFAIGTGVGIGFTDSEHHIRDLSGAWVFFDGNPWGMKEPRSGLPMWQACGSRSGFDQIVSENQGIVNDSVFLEFALRWKAYIEHCVFEHATNMLWARPASIIFTGGHIDVYADRLVNILQTYSLPVPLFTGPKHGGLLGAAWYTVLHSFGEEALIEAIVSKKVEQVAGLLQQGADVNKKDTLGKSPLMAAVATGSLAIVELLIQHGAAIDAADFAGQTPLFHAVKTGKDDIAAFLLEHGADSRHTDYWCHTAAFFAKRNQDMEKILPLHCAAKM